jgi:hypothetical protein
MTVASMLGILVSDITMLCLCIVLFNVRVDKHKPETHLGL